MCFVYNVFQNENKKKKKSKVKENNCLLENKLQFH